MIQNIAVTSFGDKLSLLSIVLCCVIVGALYLPITKEKLT